MSDEIDDPNLAQLAEAYPDLFDPRKPPWCIGDDPVGTLLQFDEDESPWDGLTEEDILGGDLGAAISMPDRSPFGGTLAVPVNPFSDPNSIRPPQPGMGGGRWPTNGSPLPPPDVLGFYLPFHLYYQPGSPHQIWGIYLIGSAIRQFGIWIWEQTGRTIQVRQCCKVAQGFVYLHEYFHHRAESLCTRLEVAAGGKRVYLAWVMSKFLAGLASNPKVVREEGMAEAYALREWTEKAKKKLMPKLNRTETIQIAAALRLYTKLTGPPYDAGLAWTSEQVFKNEQAILCEDYRDAQSYNGGSRHLAWHAATFMTRGLMTVHQQFWYVWNIPGLPVAGGGSGSPGPWTRFKPRELLGYAKQLGFSEARQKGSHLIVQKGERSVPIPIHKGRDIANGTAISIIKQLGGTYQDYCSHGGA